MKAISQKENQALNLVYPGDIFKHYKGKLYEVISIGRHTESCDLQIIYRGLYEDDIYGSFPIWIRPLSMFLEKIIVDNKETNRFVKVNDEKV